MMRLKNLMLDPREVAQKTMNIWEHDKNTIKPWRASSNFVCYFEQNESRFFLRLSHQDENTLDKITCEIDFLQYLIENYYPCNRPIKSNNGHFIETVEASNGRFHCVVFEEVKGEFLEAEDMTINQIEKWGEALGKLHLLSSKYDIYQSKHRSWVEILDFVERTLISFPDEKAARGELIKLRGWLETLSISRENYGIIHYDFEADNICWNEEQGQFLAIDFDDSMYHWFVMDIINAFEDVLGENANNDSELRWDAFIRGYTRIKSIDQGLLKDKSKFKRFDNLYTFARLIRSLQDKNMDNEPDWLEHVRNKLTDKCNRLRKGFEQPW